MTTGDAVTSEIAGNELENFVLTSLKRQKNIQDNLIPQVIERTCWTWPRAEKYVLEIQTKNNLSITLWQGKLYTILSILFCAGGLGLTIFSLSISMNLEKILPCIITEFNGSSVMRFTNCIDFSLDNLQSVQTYLSLGICLILGGIIGMFFAYRQIRHGKMIINS